MGSPLDITRRNPVEKYLCIVHYRDYLTGSAPGSMKNIFTNLLYLRLLGNEVKERKFSSCSCCIIMIYNNNNKILAVDVYCNKWTAKGAFLKCNYAASFELPVCGYKMNQIHLL